MFKCDDARILNLIRIKGREGRTVNGLFHQLCSSEYTRGVIEHACIRLSRDGSVAADAARRGTVKWVAAGYEDADPMPYGRTPGPRTPRAPVPARRRQRAQWHRQRDSAQ